MVSHSMGDSVRLPSLNEPSHRHRCIALPLRPLKGSIAPLVLEAWHVLDENIRRPDSLNLGQEDESLRVSRIIGALVRVCARVTLAAMSAADTGSVKTHHGGPPIIKVTEPLAGSRGTLIRLEPGRLSSSSAKS
jgi:hypothetical protein